MLSRERVSHWPWALYNICACDLCVSVCVGVCLCICVFMQAPCLPVPSVLRVLSMIAHCTTVPREGGAGVSVRTLLANPSPPGCWRSGCLYMHLC